ncbi:MAG: GGDEF domain-containing protein [Clostridia bacterium]|nr:GGDEF domain-containing protein [Clostridia bacterium]
MFDSGLLEVLIAADDHRLLSANAEAWWLAQNDVFVPVESFLTEESRGEFLHHLETGNHEWFLTRFQKMPEVPYLTRVMPREDGQADGAMIRVVLCRLDQLMDSFRRQDRALSAYDAMLSLHEDLFVEYTRAEDAIALYNAEQSAYSDGVMQLSDFRDALAARCDAEHLPALDELIENLRGGTPRFRIEIAQNLFNDDAEIQAVQCRYVTTRRDGETAGLIGLIHPMRTRGTQEREIAYDALTGVIGKEYITRMAQDRIDRQHAERSAVAVLDVDYFKHVNDNYGHQYGDELLRKVAGVIETELKDGGAVGRIGGDEFMMLFYHVENETALRAYLRSIKSVISAALPGTTVSIGAAVYPEAAQNYSDLFLVADYCLYLAKEKGRNRYIIHTPGKHPLLAQIKAEQSSGERNLVRGRDDLPLGDALVQMQYMARYGKRPPLDTLVNEFAVRAVVPLLSLWRARDQRLVTAGGKEKRDVDALQAFLTSHTLNELEIPRYMKDGMTIVHTVDKKEEGYPELRDALLAQQILSYIYIPFSDRSGERYALVLATVNRKVFWNEEHLKYYRIFADMLSDMTGLAPDGGEAP